LASRLPAFWKSVSFFCTVLARSIWIVGQSMRNPRSAQTITPVDWFSNPMYFGWTVSAGFSL
jgi:hypothetical protein